MRVLILGDKRMIGELNASPSGDRIQIACCSEVSEGVATLKREMFDVVILDSMIEKVVDTFQLIRSIANAPVVFMVKETEAEWARIRTLDADGYVIRGSGYTELVPRLQAIVRRLSAPAKAQPGRAATPAESGKRSREVRNHDP